MSFLDYINPFNKVVERAANIIDEVVLDKDEALRLKTQLSLANSAAQAEVEKSHNEREKERERSHRVALRTKTHWLFDGPHKLGRQLLSAGVAYAGYRLIEQTIAAGAPVTYELVMAIGALAGPAGLYTLVKGKGKP